MRFRDLFQKTQITNISLPLQVQYEHFLMIATKQDKNKHDSWKIRSWTQYLKKMAVISWATATLFLAAGYPNKNLLRSSFKYAPWKGSLGLYFHPNQRQSYTRCHPMQQKCKPE